MTIPRHHSAPTRTERSSPLRSSLPDVTIWRVKRPGRYRRPLLATGAVVSVLLAADLLFGSMAVWCDGAYRRFQIPDDYNGSGCSRIIGEWHAIFPWNWNAMEMVCLGMCLDTPMWTPED